VSGSRTYFGKVQLSSQEVSNKGVSPRYPLLKFLVIAWQIICTFHFRKWILRKFFFFLLTEKGGGRLFQLVSRDALGVAQPLPAELGPQPLYPLGDGYYSVLGPLLGQAILEDPANGSPNNTPAYNHTGIDLATTLTPSRNKVFCGSSKCSGNRFAPPSAVDLSFTQTNLEKRSTHLLPSLLHLYCTWLYPTNPVQNEAGAQPTL